MSFEIRVEMLKSNKKHLLIVANKTDIIVEHYHLREFIGMSDT